MSMKVLGPSAQNLSFLDADAAHLRNASSPLLTNSAAKREGQTQVNFASPSEQSSNATQFAAKAPANGMINFGGPSEPSSANRMQGNQQAPGGDDLAAFVRDLVSQLMRIISLMMPQNQNDPGSSSTDDAGGQKPVSRAASSPGPTDVADSSLPAAASAPQALANTAQVLPADSASKPTTSDTPTQVAAAGAASPTGDGPTAGSGPRTFNVTNTQDHAIKVGQFDKNDQLTAEMTLQPGQKGKMNFQSDFTGLLKQADSDGKYKSDASRLEFYNGFINTSYIDGRNAAIHATDNKGFEIGDTKSIADKASGEIVTADSAGNKTVAGFYDGSSDTMNKGGQFMTDTLGTGMSYMHPDDDKLPQGQNPMRHTDSMTLDVTFGKA